MNNKLEVKNISKYYGKTLGIENVSFSLKKGEIFGFIGPNGAGKSTTIRSILNLINKTGEVLIDNKLYEKNMIKQRKTIGYLPGEINLYDDLTVKEMLDYHENFYEVNPKRRKELVKRFKLDINKKIEDLSLGNLKKLAIVLTFLHDPKLIILDEPTNGLDPIMKEEFHKLLLEEKQKGNTIIYSSHILSEVSKICNQVGIIKDGKLIYIDTIDNLKNNNINIVTIESNNIKDIIKNLNPNIIENKDNYIKFKISKDINELLLELTKYKIDKLTINEPSLEDIVMKYYQ